MLQAAEVLALHPAISALSHSALVYGMWSLVLLVAVVWGSLEIGDLKSGGLYVGPLRAVKTVNRFMQVTACSTHK